MMLTLRSAKYGIKKKKYSVSNLHVISLPEARKAVESPVSVQGSSYASIIKSSIKPISLTDASTQTDPVTVLPLQESSTTQTPNSNPQQSTSNEKRKFNIISRPG